jgi:hypothetical protein
MLDNFEQELRVPENSCRTFPVWHLSWEHLFRTSFIVQLSRLVLLAGPTEWNTHLLTLLTETEPVSGESFVRNTSKAMYMSNTTFRALSVLDGKKEYADQTETVSLYALSVTPVTFYDTRFSYALYYLTL